MQASIIHCLSQARKNWEDCGRKGIRCKNRGMIEVGAPIVWMGWHLEGLSAMNVFDRGVVEQKSDDRWCLSMCVFCGRLMVSA